MEEAFDTFLVFCASLGYRERVSERNYYTVTRNADSYLPLTNLGLQVLAPR